MRPLGRLRWQIAAWAGTAATALPLLGVVDVAAQAAPKLVPSRSEIVFVTRQLGVPVQGRFARFDAQLAFDPAQPEGGRVAIDIDMRSATLDTPELDAELPKPGWFDSGRHPRARFESERIRGLGKGRYEVSGKLTVKGIARDAVVPVTLSADATKAVGSTVLKRLDFGIGDGEWRDTSVLADAVEVQFRFTLEGLKP